MQLPVTRGLRPRDPDSIGPLALLGFGIGIAAGFLLSEGFGTGAKTRVARLVKGFGRRTPTKEARTALAARVKAALALEPWLAGESIEPLPAGPSGLVLHGWVSSRAIRARAWRLAQIIASPEGVANRLLVRGEDDTPVRLDSDGEPRSA